MVFVASDQEHTPDAWTLSTGGVPFRKASRIHEGQGDYELASARPIRWRSLDWQELGGTLLLPPGYRDGERPPLEVLVDGGSMGPGYVRSFEIMDASLPAFSMPVPATRGYAVLYQDPPLRVGPPMSDLPSTVIPALNVAIQHDSADSERLAIMGQSYGSYNTLATITQTARFMAAAITAAVPAPGPRRPPHSRQRGLLPAGPRPHGPHALEGPTGTSRTGPCSGSSGTRLHCSSDWAK